MFEYNVDGVDDTRDPTQDRQTDVDEEISTTSSLKEDSKRGKNEGEDELANIRGSERHFELVDGMNQ
jgi:hypothetical protein